MGLDGYLYKRVYLNNIDRARNNIIYTMDGTVVPRYCDIVLNEIMYWRSMHDIHDWFYSNKDSCLGCECLFRGKKIKELIKLCKKEIKKHVDDFYAEQYKETIKVLSSIDDDDYFTYESSY